MKNSFSLLVTAMLVACGGEQAPENAPPEAPSEPAAQALLGNWGVETRFIDDSVDPGDDFYRYVNGGWLDTAELPTGMPMMSSFVHVHLETEEQIETIIEDILAEDWPDGAPEGEVKDFYLSYMDTEAINARGVEPVRPELDAIMAAESHADLAKLMINGFNPIFPKFSATLDDRNPDRFVVITGQSGTTLPREFYLTAGQPYESFLAAYQAYLEKLLTLAGIDAPGQRAADTVALEKQLAEASWTAAENRDKVRNYHLMTFDELEDFAPGAEWAARLEASPFGEQAELVVNQDTAVQKQAKIFGDTPLDVLKSWAATHLLSNQANYLSKDFEEAYFDFFNATLQGVSAQRPREKRAIAELETFYGEPLGKLYVEKYFAESSKEQVEQMVRYLQIALRHRLEKLDWMDEDTRREAIDKLDNFAVNIGYPDRWKDYSSLDFKPDDLFGNFRQVVNWNEQDTVAKLETGLPDWEWIALPHIINAFYAGALNSITFPAGILQPPFFDPNADPAVNFGSIAAVIGHEIGHGFDDKGSQSDGKGILRNWWTEEARAEFERRAAHLGEQYGQYAMIDGANLNGQLTMGENLGDLAGITIAYAAFKEYEGEHYDGGVAPVIDGFTGDQRFFLAYAQLWRDMATDQIWRQLALTDGHSPGRFRTNGIVRNFDPWYEAFDVTEDKDLYLPPEERVRIW